VYKEDTLHIHLLLYQTQSKFFLLIVQLIINFHDKYIDMLQKIDIPNCNYTAEGKITFDQIQNDIFGLTCFLFFSGSENMKKQKLNST